MNNLSDMGTEYDIFADFQKQIKKPAMLFEGKLVVCSLQKKQRIGKRDIRKGGNGAKSKRKVLRDFVKEKHPDLELVWSLVPLEME